jgi:hypothetical protein
VASYLQPINRLNISTVSLNSTCHIRVGVYPPIAILFLSSYYG